jgi:hypothetical protein
MGLMLLLNPFSSSSTKLLSPHEFLDWNCLFAAQQPIYATQSLIFNPNIRLSLWRSGVTFPWVLNGESHMFTELLYIKYSAIVSSSKPRLLHTYRLIIN